MNNNTYNYYINRDSGRYTTRWEQLHGRSRKRERGTMYKVFIDGSSGTTGLRIAERLSANPSMEMIRLSERDRKVPEARKEAMNQADVVFLCLPDDAAREAVGFLENPHTVLIDTSTAHRTSPDFTYGFPEIGDLREKIRAAKLIANPGCHASGFIALVAPLIEKGLVAPETTLTCFSLTGYSGGGKKMIMQYEEKDRSPLLKAPRQYGLSQTHKHLPEMTKVCGLTIAPVFCPVVADYYAGMEVTVPLFSSQVKGGIADIKAAYGSYYREGLVRFVGEEGEAYLSGNAYAGRDDMGISVYGNEDRILLVARFDNLGKGASGAAIQNMNLSLGLAEDAGLIKG